MRFTPRQVDEMSLWQWSAVVNGWNDANTPDDGSLDEDQARELFEFAQE